MPLNINTFNTTNTNTIVTDSTANVQAIDILLHTSLAVTRPTITHSLIYP